MSKKSRKLPEMPCDCPECAPEFYELEHIKNDRDFHAEGELRVFNSMAGPIILIDEVPVSELLRFHFKPGESRRGYHFGRVKVTVIPVKE